MIALLGALIIISGFLSPFFSKGKVPSILFFWIGFLVLFASRKYYPRYEPWMKWASRGVLLNAVGQLVLIQTLNIVLILKNNDIATKLLNCEYYILKPISNISQFLFPYHHVESAGGIVTFTMTYLKGSAQDFLDVLAYIGMGVLVGKLFLIRHANSANKQE